MKIVIDLPEWYIEETKDFKHPNFVDKAIAEGRQLDEDTEEPETKAYFDGQAYGWEEGRKALINDAKAMIAKEIIPRTSEDYDHDVMYQNCGLRIALKIIDNIDKADKE